jgi:hypothetical protein
MSPEIYKAEMRGITFARCYHQLRYRPKLNRANPFDRVRRTAESLACAVATKCKAELLSQKLSAKKCGRIVKDRKGDVHVFIEMLPQKIN